MISITLPTRRRPNRVRKCIKSCVDLSQNSGDLEFLVYVDEDDHETRHSTLQDEFPDTTIKIFTGKRLFNTSAMHNYLAERVSGEIIGYLADDTYFITKNWDSYVKKTFVDDQIWLVYPYEKHRGAKGAAHGFVSRKSIDIVGALMPCNSFGDKWLWFVYCKIGRSKCLENIHICHDHPVFSTRTINPDLGLKKYWDDTYSEKFKYIKNDKKIYRRTRLKRQEWINKFEKYISEYKMITTRTKEQLIQFETSIKETFLEGKITAPVHLSDGNELELINIFKNIKRTDWVFSAWRSHYHAILHGINPEWLRDQIENGFSITLCNPDYKFYTSAIVGGIIPIALGTALGLKIKDSTDHVWLFVGDMTSRTGVFHEALQYAQGHSLPISFVIEDNGISVQTPTEEVWGTNEVKPRIIHYKFKSSYPHVGAGEWVTF